MMPSPGRWSLTCTVVHYLEFTGAKALIFHPEKVVQLLQVDHS